MVTDRESAHHYVALHRDGQDEGLRDAEVVVTAQVG